LYLTETDCTDTQTDIRTDAGKKQYIQAALHSIAQQLACR